MKGGIHIAAVNKASVSPATIAQSVCLEGAPASADSVENRTRRHPVQMPASSPEKPADHSPAGFCDAHAAEASSKLNAAQRDLRARADATVGLQHLENGEVAQRQLAEILPEGILFADVDGRLKHANRPAVLLLRRAKGNPLLGKTIFHLAVVSNRSRLRADVAVVLKNGGSREGEYLLLDGSGRSRLMQVSIALQRDSHKQPAGLVFLLRDTSEQKRIERRMRELRKRSEESLKEREQLSHTIIESALHGFCMVDLHGRLLDVNESYCRMCGYTKDELLKMHISDLEVNEPSPEVVQRHIQRIMRKGGDRFETQHRRKDGTMITLEVSATYLHLRRPYLFAFLNDITERKLLEKEQRQFSRRLLEAQEAERSRMGRELHDGVNQLIASAKIRLRKVDAHMRRLGPACREILGRCDQLLLEALNENRRIAHNLHPTDLATLGLAEACRILCHEAASRTSMVVKSIVPGRWKRLAPAVELNLFRVAQEGLRNVEQHARAKFVMLKLGVKGGSVLLKIRDDGRGFNAELLRRQHSRKNGAGLINIQERAAVLGGTCAIVSIPRRGTTISVRVPCNWPR